MLIQVHVAKSYAIPQRLFLSAHKINIIEDRVELAT